MANVCPLTRNCIALVKASAFVVARLRVLMLISFDNDRASDSPLIERVWSCHSERSGTFLSVASCHWEWVVTRIQGQSIVTVRGPETKPTQVPCPADGEWLAIRFKAGTFMPQLLFGVYVGVIVWGGIYLREPRLRMLIPTRLP